MSKIVSILPEVDTMPRVNLTLSLDKMLAGANAFEISDIERMNTTAHQPGV